MEASARASLNFLEQLYLFHRQHGSAGMVIPSIVGKPVDLWKLKREVGALGGYFTVSRLDCGLASGFIVLSQNIGQMTGDRKEAMDERRKGDGLQRRAKHGSVLAA